MGRRGVDDIDLGDTGFERKSLCIGVDVDVRAR